jgi:predicted MFS family arabinose efflux permease
VAHSERAAQVGGSRPKLVTYPLVLRFVTIAGASTSFFILLPVVPLYVIATGADRSAAGLPTSAFLLATVLGEFAVPRMVARCGYRLSMATGLIMLGIPALGLAVSTSMFMIVAFCVLRGLGLAVTAVAGGSLTASLVPADRRGEGLGLAGIVSGAPALAALPLGVWLVGRIGYPPVFAVGAAAALAALVAVPGLPGRRRGGESCDVPGSEFAGRPVGVGTALRMPALWRPALAFGATTIAAGIIVTFLPLDVPHRSAGVVALAFLAQTATATVARWLAGRNSDRRDPARQVIPALATASVGLMLLAIISSSVAVVVGSLIFGLGFGIMQNASLTLMYQRVSVSGYDAVSAVWNLAYDAGMGIGAAGFGLLALGVGYTTAFLIAGAAILFALAPAVRDRRDASAVPNYLRWAVHRR